MTVLPDESRNAFGTIYRYAGRFSSGRFLPSPRRSSRFAARLFRLPGLPGATLRHRRLDTDSSKGRLTLLNGAANRAGTELGKRFLRQEVASEVGIEVARADGEGKRDSVANEIRAVLRGGKRLGNRVKGAFGEGNHSALGVLFWTRHAALIGSMARFHQRNAYNGCYA